MLRRVCIGLIFLLAPLASLPLLADTGPGDVSDTSPLAATAGPAVDLVHDQARDLAQHGLETDERSWCSHDEGAAPPLAALPGEDSFRRCGLDRLTPEQLEMLSVHLRPGRPDPHIERSVANYMEKQGWRRLLLHPAYRTDPNFALSGLRHLAAAPPDLLVLETPSTDALPAGLYLAKIAPYSVEILDPQGEVRRYSIEKRY